MAWYRTGTVAVTQNSKTITGTNTKWLDATQGIGPGQMLLLPAAGTVVMYEIAAVDSDTQLRLVDAFTGATASGRLYAIVNTYIDSVPDFARRLAAQLAYYQSQLDGWQSILSGTGTINITAPDGTMIPIKSMAEITTAIGNMLDKTKNGSDIPDKAEFRKNLGLGNAVLTDTAQTITGEKTFSAGVLNLLGTSNQKLKIGNTTGLVSTPHIDFNSGATVVDRDARIIASGGDGTNGGGTLNLQAASVQMNGVDVPIRANTTSVVKYSARNSAGYLKIATMGLGATTNSKAAFLVSGFDNYASSRSQASILAASGRGSTPTVELWGLVPPAVSNQAFSAGYVDLGNGFLDVYLVIPSFNGHGKITPLDAMSELVVASSLIASPAIQTSMPSGFVACSTRKFYTEQNTTVDANGFIKTASPILRLANSTESMPANYLDGFEQSGCGAVNDEAVGATAEHQDKGVYLITGSIGLAETGWTIEIPQDVNGNRLCFVETETAENGDITVRVSKRRFDIEMGNVVAGELMDIPAGRWIDLRLSMPAALEHAYSNSDSNSSDDNVSGSSVPVI